MNTLIREYYWKMTAAPAPAPPEGPNEEGEERKEGKEGEERKEGEEKKENSSVGDPSSTVVTTEEPCSSHPEIPLTRPKVGLGWDHTRHDTTGHDEFIPSSP